jgi:hypothetical protein
VPPKYRTLVEVLNETAALSARRSYLGEKVDRAQREAMVQADPVIAYQSYRNALGNLAERAEGLVHRHVLSDMTVTRLEGSLFQLEQELLTQAAHIDRFAVAAFNRTTQATKVEASRIMRVRIPESMAQLAESRDAFVTRQRELLQRAARDQVAAVRAAVLRGASQAEIERQLYVMKNRARLVAKMETHHLAEREMMRYALAVGSEGGWYHTAGDERVRESHWHHDGRFYLWAEKPSTLLEAGCRCKMIPDAALEE